MDFSSAGLLQDLWTALWMLLENEGLNEQQLSAVGFAEFILRPHTQLSGPFDGTRTSNVLPILG